MNTTQTFGQRTRVVLDFLIADFGATVTEYDDGVRYDWDSFYYAITKSREEIYAFFQVKDKSFPYWYMMLSLFEIREYLYYLDKDYSLSQTKITSPLQRALRLATTEEERDILELRMMKNTLQQQCLPILQGDLTILELVAIDRIERYP